MLTSEQKENARKKEDEYRKRLKKQKKQDRKFWRKKISLRKKIKHSKKLPYLENYKGYLKSPHWQKTKKQFYLFNEKKCVVCKSKENINLHHTDYRKMGIEEFGDLITLCQNCHTELHKIYGNKDLKKNTNLFIIEKQEEIELGNLL